MSGNNSNSSSRYQQPGSHVHYAPALQVRPYNTSDDDDDDDGEGYDQRMRDDDDDDNDDNDVGSAACTVRSGGGNRLPVYTQGRTAGGSTYKARRPRRRMTMRTHGGATVEEELERARLEEEERKKRLLLLEQQQKLTSTTATTTTTTTSSSSNNTNSNNGTSLSTAPADPDIQSITDRGSGYIPPLYTVPGRRRPRLTPESNFEQLSSTGATTGERPRVPPLLTAGNRDTYEAKAKEFVRQHRLQKEMLEADPYYRFLVLVCGASNAPSMHTIITNYDTAIGRKQRLIRGSVDHIATAIAAIERMRPSVDNAQPDTEAARPWMQLEAYKFMRDYIEEIVEYNRQLLSRNAAVDVARAMTTAQYSGILELSEACTSAIARALVDIATVNPELIGLTIHAFVHDAACATIVARIVGLQMALVATETPRRDYKQMHRATLVTQISAELSRMQDAVRTPGGHVVLDLRLAAAKRDRMRDNVSLLISGRLPPRPDEFMYDGYGASIPNGYISGSGLLLPTYI